MVRPFGFGVGTGQTLAGGDQTIRPSAGEALSSYRWKYSIDILSASGEQSERSDSVLPKRQEVIAAARENSTHIE